MGDLMVSLIAIILTLPIPFFILFYFFARRWTKHKWRAIHQSANISAPVFILSVHVLLLVIFEQNFLAFIVIALFVILGISLIVQYKLHEDIQLRRAFKAFFRASFLLFTLCYVGLTLFGLLHSLLS